MSRLRPWVRRSIVGGAAAIALTLAARSAMRLYPAAPAQSKPIGSVALHPPPADIARVVYPNGLAQRIDLPGDRTRAVRSLLKITRPMQYGDFVWNDRSVPPGESWIRIDLAQQMLSVFQGDHEIGSAVILYGTDGKPTPSGEFSILQRAAKHRSTLYDAEMPHMLRLTGDGVAIHASEVRRGSATHGCIGVPPEFARLLYAKMRRGDTVAILPETT